MASEKNAGHQEDANRLFDEKKRGYTEAEAAIYIGVSRSTLRQGRFYGQRPRHMSTPPFRRDGRRIQYLKDDLDRWLESGRQGDGVGNDQR